MKRETYVKRLVTSYKNLSNEEKKSFRKETNLVVVEKMSFKDSPVTTNTTNESVEAPALHR